MYNFLDSVLIYKACILKLNIAVNYGVYTVWWVTLSRKFGKAVLSENLNVTI